MLIDSFLECAGSFSYVKLIAVSTWNHINACFRLCGGLCSFYPSREIFDGCGCVDGYLYIQLAEVLSEYECGGVGR